MGTKKFWCHYIGGDGNTPKRRSIELADIHDLLPSVSNEGVKTPVWYEHDDDYYILYAQLSDKVAVMIRTMHTLHDRMLKEYLLMTDEDIDREYEEHMATIYSEESMKYHPMPQEKVAECKASWRQTYDDKKKYRDDRYAEIRRFQNYEDYLLTGNIWISIAAIKAFEEARSPYLPAFQELRRLALAEREAEERKEREERRKAAEEEARKKAEAQAKDDAKIQKLVELGLLPNNLTKMQRGQVLAALEERGRYEVAGKQKVCCTVYELITEHGFNRMSHYQERYKRDGELLAKPRNYYDVVNDTLGYGYQINGRMGALMIERNKQ